MSSADPLAAGRWQRPLRRQFPDFRHLCSHPALFAALSCQNVSLPAWLPRAALQALLSPFYTTGTHNKTPAHERAAS